MGEGPFGLTRRRMIAGLGAGLGVAASGMAGAPAALAAPVVPPVPRRLAFHHLHTGERLSATYWEPGTGYVHDALASINLVLRDFRTGEVMAIDPALLDVLHDLAARVEARHPFEVIGGYRSPKTNEMLRHKSKSSGVARKSLHMVGKAIDIRVNGVRLEGLRKAALSLRRGGVGYYPKSDFIHVDTGRVRQW